MKSKKNKLRKLTGKQQSFVQHYCGDCAFNATQAAIKAGYSVKTAYSIGNENLSKPEIIAAMAEEIADRAEKTDVEVAEIVQELRKIAFSGTLFSNSDKLKALELLGKFKAMYTDRLATVSPGDANALSETQQEELTAFSQWRTKQLSQGKPAPTKESNKIIPFKETKTG